MSRCKFAYNSWAEEFLSSKVIFITPTVTDLLDGVFVLEVDDLETLYRRLDERVARDPTDWGGKPEEKELLARLHRTKEDIPGDGIVIDAQPLASVVDEILSHINAWGC